MILMIIYLETPLNLTGCIEDGLEISKSLKKYLKLAKCLENSIS